MKHYLLPLVATVLLAGCISPPKMDEAARVVPGVTRAEVVQIMGEPRLTYGPTNGVEALMWMRMNGLAVNTTTIVLRDQVVTQYPQFAVETTYKYAEHKAHLMIEQELNRRR